MEYVAYYRVSTQKQGQSGLGLEAQRAAVTSYEPIAEFVEIESGKLNDRSELNKAMAFARANKATLIVAKLDRLSRNAHFILGLMEHGVRIRCADMPDADEFQLHLFAILAQKERKMISERTKAALQAAKARGVKLGGVQPLKATEVAAFDERIHADIQALMEEGIEGAAALARALNERGVRTPRGSLWGPGQIIRVLRRKAGA